MPFKSKYNTDSTTGKVHYGHKVLVSVISLATMEIHGVARLQGKRVRMDVVGDRINVDVYIEIMLGFCCADVAYRVQENIKRNIESITAYRSGTINVNILSVSLTDTTTNTH